MERIRVSLVGMGRMGRQIARRISEEKDLAVVSAFDVRGSDSVGKDVGLLAGVGNTGVLVSSSDELEPVLKRTRPEVVVDFTVADACVKNAGVAGKLGFDLVVGTTGFSEQQRRDLEGIVGRSGVGAVISPNYSVGVNVFWHVLAEAARMLPGYDIEIVEAHHRLKRDAPSGTALKTAEVIAKSIERDLKKCAVYGMRGECPRKSGEIGIHAIRAGDIVGDHTVYFGAVGERLEFTHRAHSRDAFVNGVLSAVRFVRGRRGVFGMDDVLGLK